MSQNSILVVEDESIIAIEMRMKLRKKGYRVPAIASSAQEAIQMARDFSPDLIIMDIMLKGPDDGIDAALKIVQNLSIPIIYLTGNSHLKNEKRLVQSNPVDILIKPVPDWILFETIEKALNPSE